MNNIRNFAIIAHVDHGKSTLADRFLELTGIVEKGSHDEQMLDRNPISRERGITIKLAPVRMSYKGYILNLIDTPGHVDFSYEVDRTLSCVEGVILLVDATQGIQAQTIANAYKAVEKNLVIIPVINKIDLPGADIEKTKKQIIDFFGINEKEIFMISAKTGDGVDSLLKAVVEKIPSPKNSQNDYLQALIFDSYYDNHRGVIIFVRVFNGEIKKGKKVKLANLKTEFEVSEVGYFLPDLMPADNLKAGEIGYLVTNLKNIREVAVGDTVLDKENNQGFSFSGYKKIKPMVFASIFPTETSDFPHLKKALEKLYLNDSSLEFSSIYSQAFGAGYKVGFLGLLHADVVRERLEREFNLSLILTPPQVEYQEEQNGFFKEPVVKVMIITPSEYLGAVMKLCQNYRAKFLTMDSKDQIILEYEMPMAELISDFFDNLKSVTSGYASLDWYFLGYQQVKAGKLELLLNGNVVEEFSEIVVEEKAYQKANFLTNRLKELIPRQQYEVRIQGRYKGKIIASSRIAPFRKDVLVKSGKVLGTGDVGRKKKLLEKQKEGKKKMKMVGKVEIPKEAFIKLFNKNNK